VEETTEILKPIVSENEFVLAEPEPVVQLHEPADSSMNFICRPWAKTAVYRDMTKRSKSEFDAADISIPFPQRDLHVYRENGCDKVADQAIGTPPTFPRKTRPPAMKPALLVTTILALSDLAAGQEMEPRRWSHLPINCNFGGLGYAYTEADIAFDPVLLIQDAKLDLHTAALKYIRTFELFGKSARFDLVQAYQNARWQGLLDGVPTTVTRQGWSDTSLRMAVNLLGAPPLEGKEFARYRQAADCETIVGAGLVVTLPTGEYFEDKLLNIGGNRFVIRPQLGVVHQRGPWTCELTAATWFYTDNDEFWNGNQREQDPLFALQGHLIYSFRPGLWVSASAGYGFGAESTVNGVRKDDHARNVAWALSAGYPVTPKFGIKLTYVGIRTQQDTGLDSDTLAFSASYFW
jgi:hypothetical protein